MSTHKIEIIVKGTPSLIQGIATIKKEDARKGSIWISGNTNVKILVNDEQIYDSTKEDKK